ncbi:hypothetical protein BLS_009636 [Venturia inaequalis]|uniref:Thioredoxin-like protein n=1 Tax=Venturia inaequalis TaxID=5025 RepID=A0A8H3VDM5_VENIN|nr:hypothetical protein EG327_005673 [Venturia inaequalis]KAE9985158.1 hypothetical protein BLS_009636 [Venturia inaequalis]KAE9985355.1 hypothetical protein EG328_007608 [Venturia inaequalis]RDI86678.1 hypothetical protein Vi05172_g3527 [Venturia inaequalis]
MFKKLFGEHGAKDIITVFHRPSLPQSTRVVTFLKQTQANAKATATEDQASSHPTSSKPERTEFDLDVQEAEPTEDQLKSILEYVGESEAGKVVEGASSVRDAVRKVKEDAGRFRRPLIVDWHQGKVVVGEEQSEILRLLRSLPKND